MRGGPIEAPPLRPVAPYGPRLLQAACCTHSRSRTSLTWAETTRGRRGFRPGLERTGVARSFKAGNLAIPAAADSNRPRRASPPGGRLKPPWPPGSLASEHGTDERRATPPQPVLWKRRLVPLRQKDCTERLAGPDASGGLRSTSFGSCQLAERVPGRDPIDRVTGADEPRENDRQAWGRQEGVACQTFRLWDVNGARWTGNEVAKAFRVRARTVSDVRPCRTIEGFERLASFRGRRSSSAEESLAWPRIRDERALEAHRDLQI